MSFWKNKPRVFFLQVFYSFFYSSVPTTVPTVVPTAVPTLVPTIFPMVSIGYVYATTFNIVGSTFPYKVPKGVTSIRFDMCGASSGTCNGGYAGLGGCLSSNLTVSSGETLTVNVGGVGDNAVKFVQANGGYNGGGIHDRNGYTHTYVYCVSLLHLHLS